MTNFKDVAAADDIPVGEARAFLIDGKMIGVFNCDGEFLAINDLCPHAGASLSAGYLEGEIVACPWHAWRFNVRDGSWCDNPNIKTDTYELKVEDGRILVGLPAADDEDNVIDEDNEDGEVDSPSQPESNPESNPDS